MTRPKKDGSFLFEHSVLAATYSCLTTTIGADGLNCRVRDENGCNTVAKPPTQKAQIGVSRAGFCSFILKTKQVKAENKSHRIFP